MSVEVTTTGGTIVSASTGSGTSVNLTSSSTSVSVTSPAANSVSITSKGPKGDTGATGPIGPEIAGGPYLPLSAGSGFPLTGELDMTSNKITDVLAGTNNLDAVNYQQLTAAVLGVLVYKGIWNATTNDPALESGAGTVGSYYIVSTAGTTALDGISDWVVGDWAVFSDLPTDAWQKIDNTSILGGGGTGGKLPVWTGSGTSKTLGDSVITEASSKIGIGTANPSDLFTVVGNARVTGQLKLADGSASAPSIAHRADENTGMFFPANDTIGFTTSNTERLRVTSAGRVGIGTASPASTIHAVGSGELLRLDDSSATGNPYLSLFQSGTRRSYIQLHDTDNTLHIASEYGDVAFKAASSAGSDSDTEYMRIKAGGNVGIGTASPGFNLDIYEDSSETLPMIKLRQDGVGDATIGFNIIGSTQASVGLDNSDEDKFKISRSEALGSSTQLTIDSSGNVGIGTTSPRGKLDLTNGSSGQSYSNVSGLLIDVNGTSNSYYALRVGSNSGNSHLSVTNAGNVGIGTASPAAKLDVAGNTDANVFLGRARFGSHVSDYLYLSHYDQASQNNYALNQSAAGSTSLNAPTGQNVVLRINNSAKLFVQGSSGNVGIGTTSPNRDLQIGDGSSNSVLALVGPTTGLSQIALGDTDDDNYAQIILDNSTNKLQIQNGGGGTVSNRGITLDSSENVGIGTSSPASKLHVAGTVQVGVDDTGHDVKFYGATSGKYMLWDESADSLMFPDSTYAQFGTSGDLSISHNGSTSLITNYTGDLKIVNHANDKDIIFQSDDGSGGTATYFSLDGSAATHDGSATTSLTTNWPDKSKITLGTGSDLQIYHDGSNSYIIDAGTGDLLNYFSNDWKVIKYGSSEICIAATSDGSVDLYYDSALKLKTVTAGVEITGGVSATAGVRMGNDTATASADNVGTQRYRATANNSYVEMCMQTAASGYSWVIIKENSW